MKYLNVSIIIFSFAINSFGQFNDCDKAYVLCNNEKQHISVVQGAGEWSTEVSTSRCLEGMSFETNSAWVKWSIKKNGVLEFDINPMNKNDDVDFILFQLENWDDCYNRIELRCMASGKNVGLRQSNDHRCIGKTGLKSSVKDIVELKGCYGPDDNYLSAVDVSKGDMFLLVINNCSSTQGFDLSFGNDTKIGLPNNKTINNQFVRDDKNNYFIFGTNVSNPKIYDYIKWDFGEDAHPKTAVGSGPHIVNYSASGEKSIMRERLFSSGCQDAKNLTLYVEKSKTNIDSDLLITEVFPNPSHLQDDIFFTVESREIVELNLDIVDVYGRVFKTMTLPRFEGIYKSKFSTVGMGRGSYFIRITNDERLVLHSFIVQ